MREAFNFLVGDVKTCQRAGNNLGMTFNILKHWMYGFLTETTDPKKEGKNYVWKLPSCSGAVQNFRRIDQLGIMPSCLELFLTVQIEPQIFVL